jgi:dTDP-4-amino-4,6-dideoxygalactose transaminase
MEMTRNIPLGKPFFGEEEVASVRQTLESGWVAQGPKVKQFEESLSEYCGAKYGIAVNSCTSALHMSLLALGITEGDKVIVPDFTFLATGNVILHVGAEPVFVDINLDSFCMDVGGIEENVDEHVKLIFPVHAFGYPSDMPVINRLAKKHGVQVVEDAALAIGSQINGCKVGSFDNISCFSLQGRKIITTGEGGIIVLNDEQVASDLRALRSQGMYQSKGKRAVNLPDFKKLGFSYRMSDIHASIGIEQMKRIENFIDRRNKLAAYYRDEIEDKNLNLTIPNPPSNIRHNYQSYVILVKKNRDKIISELKRFGIESTIGTYSLSSQPLFKRYRKKCPNSSYAFSHTIALPMYHELNESNIDYIVNKLKACLN